MPTPEPTDVTPGVDCGLLPCCNVIEPEGRPCPGLMRPGWPEYVCNTCLSRCGAQVHPIHAPSPEKGVGLDYPTAWQIAARVAPEYHHNRCSYNVTSGGMLCDCDVLTKSPEYVAAVDQSLRGRIERANQPHSTAPIPSGSDQGADR